MPRKPTTIDEYLATVMGEKRAALDKLRKTIRAIVPKARQGVLVLPIQRVDSSLTGR